MIEIHNYHKSYQDHHVLSFPELILPKGIYYFSGINGSGKTTLFKSISGMISFEGKCVIDGVQLKDQPVRYRSLVSYCPAEPSFPGYLSLRDMADFVGKARKTTSEQVEELKNILNAQDFFEQPTGAYSSGMLKKSGLLLALLSKPSVIILDEPFTTIDQKTRNILFSLIKNYADQGTTFLISSHHQHQEESLSYSGSYLVKDKTLQRLG